MNLDQIKNHILSSIPILQKMGVHFDKVTPDVCILKVELAPNKNHKDTAFGGSLYSVCAASAYGILFWHQLSEKILDKDIVIADGRIKYLKGVSTDFTAEAVMPASELHKIQKLRSFSKSPRILIKTQIFDSSRQLCAEFEGEFAFVSK